MLSYTYLYLANYYYLIVWVVAIESQILLMYFCSLCTAMQLHCVYIQCYNKPEKNIDQVVKIYVAVCFENLIFHVVDLPSYWLLANCPAACAFNLAFIVRLWYILHTESILYTSSYRQSVAQENDMYKVFYTILNKLHVVLSWAIKCATII